MDDGWMTDILCPKASALRPCLAYRGYACTPCWGKRKGKTLFTAFFLLPWTLVNIFGFVLDGSRPKKSLFGVDES